MNAPPIITTAPPVVGPRDVALLRPWLREQWNPGRIYWRVAAGSRLSPTPVSRIDPDLRAAMELLTNEQRAESYARWERRTLGEAELWWVAPEMVDLLEVAARTVPDDLTVDDLEHVEPAGLLVFGRPLAGLATEGTPIEVDALLWGPSVLPPLVDGVERPTVDEMGSIRAWSISSYSKLDLDEGMTQEQMQHAPAVLYEVAADGRGAPGSVVEAHGTVWAPLGRSDWPVGDRIDLADLVPDEASKASFVEDRKLLVAFWTLIHQQGIAETFATRPARPLVRRVQRAGLPREAAEVRVVRLRELHRAEPHPDHEPIPREHDHRWIVSGHWRNARVGPGRTQRRLVWVHPYLKGPPDAPLRQPTTVRAWVR